MNMYLFLLFCYVSLVSGSNWTFPADFMFGAATSSYQVEGAWNVSDKAVGIFDKHLHENPEYGNADTACNSYYLYKQDVQMCKAISLDFYRISISWPRLLPTGFKNYVSKDGLRYYNNLIDELRDNNIEPVVTLFHWDLPQKLQDLGGLASPFFEEWYTDYAEVAFRHFGDRVKYWYTFNEPQIYCQFGYSGLKSFAPNVDASGVGNYMCSYNILKAHARAYHLYNDTFRKEQGGYIAMVVQVIWPEARTEEDQEVGNNVLEYSVGVYIDPIYSSRGGYSPYIKELIANKSAEQGFARSRLPDLTPNEIEYIRGTYDFLAVNFYAFWMVSKINPEVYVPPAPSWPDDMGVMVDPKYEYEHFDEFSRKDATKFRALLKFLSNRYNNVEIKIAENGFTSARINDDDKIRYLRSHLEELLKCIHIDKLNITAYTVWSLMDNYEWIYGFGARYGLYAVNFTDMMTPRTPRKSAFVYKHIIENRMIDWHYNPHIATP